MPDTFHDYSILTVKAQAEAMGFTIIHYSLGARKGPDLVLKHGSTIVYVESEIGHHIHSGTIENIVTRIERTIEKDHINGPVKRYLVIITNTPRRLIRGLEKYSGRLAKLGFGSGRSGENVYIVPALLAREIMPAILATILCRTRTT